MAIAVGSVSNGPAWGNRTNTTVTAPASIANGDLLVALVAVGNGATSTVTVTAPAGWTQVTNSPSVHTKTFDPYTICTRCYYKIAASEAGNYTWTHAAADTESYIYRLTGTHATTPIDVTPAAQSCVAPANGSVTTFPTLTTVTNGCFIIFSEIDWDSIGSGTVSGTTPTITLRRGGSTHWIGDGTQTTAGATGARTRTSGNFTGTALNDYAPWASIVVPIRPAATGAYTLTAETGTLTLAGQAADLKYGPWLLVGVGTSVEVATTAHTLTVPAGVAAGDLLIAVISSRIASTTSITLPTGGEWTRIAEQKTNNILTTGSAVASGMMAYCVRGASNPNLTFTHPATPAPALGRIVAYRGGYAGGWLDQSTSATTAVSTTAVSVTGVTTLYPADLIVVGLCGGQEAAWSAVDATSPSVASGATNTTQHPTYETWLERADQVTTTGNDTSLGIADAVKRTAGATGNITATAGTAASHAILIAAFRPPVVSLAPYTMVADTGTLTLSGQTVVPKVALPAGLGTLTAAGQTTILRFGHKAAAGLGTLTAAGQTVALRYTRAPTVAGLGTLTLSGRPVALGYGRRPVAGLGTLILAGQPATLKRTYVMPAGTGTLTLAGQTVILTKSAAVIHYTMPADAGTLTLSGQPVILRYAHKLIAGTGTLTLAGQTVVPRVTLPAGTGTLTASGQAVTLRATRKLTAGQGTLTLAGQTVALRAVRKLVAGLGTLTLSGQTAVLKVTLPAGLGTLTLSGRPVTLSYARKMVAGLGTLTLSGQPATLTKTGSFALAAGTGTLTLTGQTAMLRTARKMVAGLGTLTLSGQTAALRIARKLVAGLGTLTLAGQTIVLRSAHKLVAGLGTLTLAGQAVTLTKTTVVNHYIMPAGTGTLYLAGQPVNLISTAAVDYAMAAAPGTLVLTGNVVTLDIARTTVTQQPGRLTFGRKVVLRRW